MNLDNLNLIEREIVTSFLNDGEEVVWWEKPVKLLPFSKEIETLWLLSIMAFITGAIFLFVYIGIVESNEFASGPFKSLLFDGGFFLTMLLLVMLVVVGIRDMIGNQDNRIYLISKKRVIEIDLVKRAVLMERSTYNCLRLERSSNGFGRVIFLKEKDRVLSISSILTFREAAKAIMEYLEDVSKNKSNFDFLNTESKIINWKRKVIIRIIPYLVIGTVWIGLIGYFCVSSVVFMSQVEVTTGKIVSDEKVERRTQRGALYFEYEKKVIYFAKDNEQRQMTFSRYAQSDSKEIIVYYHPTVKTFSKTIYEKNFLGLVGFYLIMSVGGFFSLYIGLYEFSRIWKLLERTKGIKLEESLL